MLTRLESSLSLLVRLNNATRAGDREQVERLRAELDERDQASGYHREFIGAKREQHAATARECMRRSRQRPLRLAFDEAFLE